MTAMINGVYGILIYSNNFTVAFLFCFDIFVFFSFVFFSYIFSYMGLGEGWESMDWEGWREGSKVVSETRSFSLLPLLHE